MSELVLPESYTPKCGDDLFTTNDYLFGVLTKWASRYRGEAPTIATHQGKFLSSTQTVEAFQKSGVIICDWDARRRSMAEEGHDWCILSRFPSYVLSDVDQELMATYIRECVGWKYSNTELVLQFVDGLFGKVVGHDVLALRKWGDLWRNGVICSKTANRPDIKLDLIPRRLEYAAPDSSLDYKLESGVWTVVDKSKNWPCSTLPTSR